MSSILLFNLDNWRKFKSLFFSPNEENFSVLRDEIKAQNSKGFIVVYLPNKIEQEGQIELYKKHSTSILKSIIIGNVSLIDFKDLKRSIDEIENQSNIIKREYEKPEFSKYSAQRKIYFPD